MACRVETVTLLVNGEGRKIRLVVPSQAKSTSRLIIAFHGFGETPEAMAKYSQFDQLSQEGFVVAYPDGRNASWLASGERLQAEIALFDALVERLALDHAVDRGQIFLAGMSQGATLVHALAQHRGEMVQGVVAHSGAMPPIETDARQMPSFRVLLIHGQNDTQISPSESRDARDQYSHWGHEVQLLELPGLGHAWVNDANARQSIREFLRK